MTPRDRRAVLIGGVIVVAGVFGLRIIPSSLRSVSRLLGSLRERASLLARTREELGTLPALRDSATVLSQALVALAPQVLSGSTPAEAGADLAGRLNLAAGRAPAKIERLDPLPDSSGPDRLGHVRVHAGVETDVRGLIALLRTLEIGEEIVRLDELHVEAPDPGGVAARGPELLKIELVVSGWYIKPRVPAKRET